MRCSVLTSGGDNSAMDEQANAKLTFAVVGVGMIGKRHLQALRDVERCCVKAVVDVNVEVVKLVAREFGIPEAYTDYKRVLDDAQIDAILIATPPF
ncbi:MAG TPA: hypothetical protein EYP10_03025, partial [Armatimonadetes bacterium]|nr:hypothetical protein [Armatimonadota bacterium]